MTETVPTSTIQTGNSQVLTAKEYTDLRFKEVEIEEKTAVILIKKLEVLEVLLSGHRPGEKTVPGSETNWEPIITDEYELKTIRNKVVELVKKL